jgi:hypothetical protein
MGIPAAINYGHLQTAASESIEIFLVLLDITGLVLDVLSAG